MSEYRVRATGEVKSQGQIRRDNPNVSLPRVWKAATCDSLGIDPVLAAPKPEKLGTYTTIVRDGVVQDANGNWVYNWTERHMFNDYVDEEGNTVTRASQEEAYQTKLDTEAGDRVRAERNTKLAETDWWASSDLTMTTEQTTYRQALRDITDHTNFPYLEDADWPTKPE